MKKLSLLFVLVLAIGLVFCSCGKEETPYDYDLNEYVTLGEFPKVEFDMEEVQEEIDKAIEDIAVQYAEKKDVTDRAAEEDDIVNIDYTGKIDGKEFEGGSAKGYDLTLGSGTFIAGFEDGLVGKKIGETVDLNLVFPEDYKSTDLQGKDVVFTVKINSIKSQTIPALSNDMVKEKTEYETVSAFVDATRKEKAEDHIWQNFIDSCKMNKYPQAEVKTYYDQMLNSYSQMAVYNGMTLESMVTSFYGYKTVDEFLSYAMDSAMLTVKEEAVIYKTVRDNDISLTDEEYDKLALELAKEAQYETVKEYEEYMGKENVKLRIYMDKIIEMAYKANDVKFGE